MFLAGCRLLVSTLPRSELLAQTVECWAGANVQSSNLESDDIVLTSTDHLVLNHYAFFSYLIFSNTNAYGEEQKSK